MGLRVTRKSEQAIRIGDDIVVTILRVKGRYVRLQIDAPREMKIMREELIDQSRLRAGSGTPSNEATAHDAQG